jgi:uncharacterized protein YfaS (alpha-2-macroglobulin family)
MPYVARRPSKTLAALTACVDAWLRPGAGPDRAAPARSIAALSMCLPLWAAAAPAASVTENPARIERVSPQGSVKGVRQIAVRFSDAMVAFGDPRLPAPFDLDCPAAGSGRWADPRNWVYDFDADLPAGIRCRLALRPDVRTLAGKPVAGDTHFSFDTGGPAIRASLPEEGSEAIDENQAFILALDTPATPESVAANVYCAIDGIAERVGVDVLQGEPRDKLLAESRRLGYGYRRLLSEAGAESGEGTAEEALQRAEAELAVLRCRRAFPPQTGVRLVWGKGVASTGGLAATEDRVLAFKTRPAFTARLQCQRVNAGAGCLPMLPMTVGFSAPVAVEKAGLVRLVGADGAIYAPQAVDATKHPFIESIPFDGPFPEHARLRVEMPAGLTDDAGRPLANAARFPLELVTDEYPPLAKFAGDFGIIETKAGGVLPVTVRNLESEISGKRLAPGQPTGAQAVMPGKLRRVDPDNAAIIHWLKRVQAAAAPRGEWEEIKGTGEGEPTRRWKERTGADSVFSDEVGVQPFSLPKPLGARPLEVVGIPLKMPGFYVVELASPKLGAALLGEQRPRYVSTAALVTNLAVHFKWGREASLVWVTSLDKAQPVAGAAVRISDYCKGTSLWEGETDANGIAAIGASALPAPDDLAPCDDGSPMQLLISARTPRDMSFALSGWNRGIAPADFNLPTAAHGGSLIAHSVLDRTLFRAGETVSMKHFFRRHAMAGLEIPADERPDSLKIRHEGSGQEYALPLALDDQGIAETAWTIPSDARLGAYQLYLERREPYHSFHAGGFRVEQFRTPSMKAVIQPPPEPLVKADAVAVDLFVSYLSGGGAANAPVKLRTQMQPKSVTFPDYADFTFDGRVVREGIEETGPDVETGDETTAAAQVVPLALDKAGTARAVIPNLPKSAAPQDLVIELEYPDANGELLTVARRIPLWPARLSLGLRTEGWVASRERLRFQVVALGLDGKPVINQPVAVDLFQKTTYSHRKRLIGGFYAYEDKTEVKRLDTGCEGRTDAAGLLFCEVRPDASGQLILNASSRDEHGNTASASSEVWIAGKEDWWFANAPSDRMDLLPEKKEYRSGEVARFQVRMPFRQATALVTVEREGVIDSFVAQLSGREPVVEVPIKANHAPNVYVSVLAVRGRIDRLQSWLADAARKLRLPLRIEGGQATHRVDLSKPAYRLGMASINVDWAPHRLDVHVVPDRVVYPPRDRARVRVVVGRADAGPLPARAEIALAAVDEALLELKPNDSWALLERMMDKRGIDVSTATAQMQVVGKRHYGRKAVPHGGGGGRQAAREVFEPLLLWRGRVSLDDHGEAEIEVPLNDSLTAFRLVAVASAGAGHFGTGQGTVRTSQNLMLHAGLPPLVREGDRFRAAFTVRNASGGHISARATARVVPANLAGGAADFAPAKLELPPGAAHELAWETTAAPGAGRLDWEVTVEQAGGTGRDQVRVKQDVIPVYPVRVYQATLARIDRAFTVPVEKPADAAPGPGGVRVELRTKLAENLSGVADYMSRYPYRCLEQRLSRAVALRDRRSWDELMSTLSNYLDEDGLLRYFAADWLEGSDTLSAYALAIAAESGWPIPDDDRRRLQSGLKRFIQGRVIRDSPLATADLAIRKLAAMEALSRYGEATPDMLDSVSIDPKRWPTSAVVDWLNVLKRLPAIPQREARLQEAQRILRSRLYFQGTMMNFSTERADALWWLMISPDVNAVRSILSLLDEAAWRDDLPRMVIGALGRQRQGHWNTTAANAWGVLAMEKFSAAFEATPVSGHTSAVLAGETKNAEWNDPTQRNAFDFLWPPAGRAPLTIEHFGQGQPWAAVQSRAAIPLKAPVFAGFGIRRAIHPLEQKQAGIWSRGDVARVRLELEAQADMAWVVVDDPVPAGASVIGGGLGGDARLLGQNPPAAGPIRPVYEERRFDAYRAYYRFVPKGSWTLEYTVRFNNPGVFGLPPTRVEALYAPEMAGELPNETLEVRAPP